MKCEEKRKKRKENVLIHTWRGSRFPGLITHRGLSGHFFIIFLFFLSFFFHFCIFFMRLWILHIHLVHSSQRKINSVKYVKTKQWPADNDTSSWHLNERTARQTERRTEGYTDRRTDRDDQKDPQTDAPAYIDAKSSSKTGEFIAVISLVCLTACSVRQF